MEELGHTIQLTERIETDDPPDEKHDTYGIYFGGITPKICVGYTKWNLFLTIWISYSTLANSLELIKRNYWSLLPMFKGKCRQLYDAMWCKNFYLIGKLFVEILLE